MNKYEHELEIMRRKLWADAWVATANSSNCRYPSSCTSFSDEALKEFDKRFKALINPEDEVAK